ncbi:DUF6973 domain-containing protein [Sinomicrobium weinanense]|uniref:DUF6973 domain-containing protein n=1 Tax=Sinomicrobium weinanense TaxID=2842200 RepID=A0A926Q4F0_9FLAO|nr:hypothetical protein [Sinomicrobium weinanense]MBC9798502.1 hypothetical protein [Sinomicrobium weinanense]MBU3126015.1 hypothetical protein [Sinomicrobium weinanense]
MMEKLLKFIFTAILFTSVSLFFFGCQKESVEPALEETIKYDDPGIDMRQGTIDNFKGDIHFHESLKKIASNIEKAKQNNNASKKKQNFTIDSNKVVRVKRNSGTTYSILAKREESQTGTVDNLIISIDQNNSINSYILSYIPENKGFVSHPGHSAYAFNGSLKVTSVDMDVSGLLAQKTSFIEITVLVCDWSEGNVHGTWHLAGSNCTPGFIQEVTVIVDYEVNDGPNSTISMGEYTTIDGEIVSGVGSNGGAGGSTPILILGDDENVYVECEIILDALEGLSSFEKNWLRNNLWFAQKLFDFLEPELFSPEAKEFAELWFHAEMYQDYDLILTHPVFTQQDPYNVWNNVTQTERDLVKSNPVKGYKIFKNREIATFMTVNKFNRNGRNDKSDAFRHAFYQAINTRDVGISFTGQFADAHESEVPSNLNLEKKMDLYNNEVGIMFAASNPDMTNQGFADAIYQKILDGELRYLSPLSTIVPPNYGIISTTKLTPTNQ